MKKIWTDPLWNYVGTDQDWNEKFRTKYRAHWAQQCSRASEMQIITFQSVENKKFWQEWKRRQKYSSIHSTIMIKSNTMSVWYCKSERLGSWEKCIFSCCSIENIEQGLFRILYASEVSEYFIEGFNKLMACYKSLSRHLGTCLEYHMKVFAGAFSVEKM